jgi:HD superfamily phosphohydrolase
MLLHAISKENISIVDHYLDDKLTKHLKEIIANNVKKNIKQIFRQPNISNLNIIQEDNEYVTIEGLTRYISYYTNRQTNKYVSGDNKNRITKTIVLKFRKNNIKSKSFYSCPNCGAGLNINLSAICSYCGLAVDERFSDYVLYSIS